MYLLGVPLDVAPAQSLGELSASLVLEDPPAQARAGALPGLPLARGAAVPARRLTPRAWQTFPFHQGGAYLGPHASSEQVGQALAHNPRGTATPASQLADGRAGHPEQPGHLDLG